MERGFWTPSPKRRTNMCSPLLTPLSDKYDDFHAIHKVPTGDSPYVRAKHVQLIDKNPSKAISMFWAAINSGDRVDSALKDMAVVMKQLNRSDEAIEAIKSFRHLCPQDSQQSLDNILLELYKRSGRLEEQIELLQAKLKQIEEGLCFRSKNKKMVRSQGKKIQITVEQEYSRLLGNLAWAYLQQDNYLSAETLYRKALSLEPDKNKQCNLAICLMYTDRITEAKFLLHNVLASSGTRQMDESFSKSYERAILLLDELETEKRIGSIRTPFSSILNRRPADEYDKETVSLYESQKPCSSPFPTSYIRQAPFTQPRTHSRSSYDRRDQGRADHGCNRNLCFEQPVKQKRSSSPTSADWRKAPLVDDRKLQTLSVGNRGWKEKSWVNDEQEEVPKEGRETVAGATCSPLSEITNGVGSKKSWADMVEEDEQKLSTEKISPDNTDLLYALQSQKKCWTNYEEEYDDENMNSNLLCETPMQQHEDETLKKIEAFDFENRYFTQPGITATARAVKRSLCFDQNEKPSVDVNGCSSSSSRTRSRLQVFRDITDLSEN